MESKQKVQKRKATRHLKWLFSVISSKGLDFSSHEHFLLEKILVKGKEARKVEWKNITNQCPNREKDRSSVMFLMMDDNYGSSVHESENEDDNDVWVIV